MSCQVLFLISPFYGGEQLAVTSSNPEYRHVILEFFRSEVLTSAPPSLRHGRKASAFCRVDGIGSVFGDEAQAIARAITTVK
jgi:hypothetical protein